MDPHTSRFWKIGDALSQLANVAFLPNHRGTTSNESISGRAYRCGWTRAQAVIDTLFFFDSGPDGGHCKRAYFRDYYRAFRACGKL